MLSINTIRYMGTKAKLLDKIIPAIISITPKGGTVCDIMAGSNAVSYALKEFFTVYTNDIQKYSFVISKAMIENQSECIADGDIDLLLPNIEKNKKEKIFSFFEDVYSGTYFSREQCQDIDSIRYAIEKVDNEYKKNLFLLALMCAMCKVQSTPGHFAQFMPSTHKRIIPLQKMSILKEFVEKCRNYTDVFFSDSNNKCFCEDYHVLLSSGLIDDVDTIYLDSPYSQEQYSRFYHILETVVKYDYPNVDYKAKYRTDRFMSNFCYKDKVSSEFDNIFSYCNSKNKNIVVSYSTSAVLSIENLLELCKKYFKNVDYQEIDYRHSTQGKGISKTKEVIISCYNNYNCNAQ